MNNNNTYVCMYVDVYLQYVLCIIYLYTASDLDLSNYYIQLAVTTYQTIIIREAITTLWK